MNILFGRCKKFEVNNAESTYKVHYLGNVMTSLLKGSFNIHSNQLKSLNTDPRKGKYLNKLIEEQNQILSNLNKKSIEINNNEQDDDDEDDDDQLDLKENYYVNNKMGSNNVILNSVDKSVKILWENHLKHNGHAGLKMKLTLTQGGLRVDTKDHGLTEYYGHRIHFVQAHPFHPKLFVWVYQHVGKNLKTEIRCHAALCQKTRDAKSIEYLLNNRIQQTFLEYKREKRRQQNSRLCNTKNGGLLSNQMGCKKRVPSRITRNYKPPVQHGMCSAPKLDDVLEEEEEEDEEDEDNEENEIDIEVEEETHFEITNYLRKSFKDKQLEQPDNLEMNISQSDEDEEEEEDVKDDNDDEDDGDENEAVISDEEEEDSEIKKIEETMSTTNLDLHQEDYFYNQTNTEFELTQTTVNSSLQHEKYDNRPITQQLSLSSSSESSSGSNSISTSPSPNSSASSTPHHANNNDNIATKNNMNSNKLINESGSSSTISNVDSGIEELNKIIKLSPTRITNCINNDKGFTEVSYDFLSDLSKLNEMNFDSNQHKLRYSKSFNKHASYTKSISNNNNNSHNIPIIEDSENNNSFNPFRRSSISKSFSAFTSRFKNQSLRSKKIINDDLKLQQVIKKNIPTPITTNNLKSIEIKAEMKQNAQQTIIKTEINKIHYQALANNSRASSPTLSSCSYSSSSSTHQKQESLNNQDEYEKNNINSDLIISL